MAKKKEVVEKQDESDNQYTYVNGDTPPSFEDPKGFVDDVSDEELLGDLLASKPKESDGVESIIIIDGSPKVGADKKEKLKGVITKIFSKFGAILNDYYPHGEDGVTKGYIFIEYDSPSAAKDAVANANNFKLDKQHTFLVNLFSDFEKYRKIPDTWEAPTPLPYKEKPNLQEWLMEPDAYDQYLIMNSGFNVQVWLNSSPHPTLLEERERWTDSAAIWSPQGTYLATIHSKGVILWGGASFERIIRCISPNVDLIDFSPCEKYLVMYSQQMDSHGESKLTIFDIRTGMEKRSFTIEGLQPWPIFKWSQDDKYFARIGTNVLSVYETPSFGLLDKKSIQVNGIRDFAWSPTDNIIAYWVAEDKDVPARVVLMEIPSRQEIRSNNLFNVADCKIHWQKAGDYLCVKLDRYAKVKKEKGEFKYSGIRYNLEIFHMRDKNIPLEIVEVKEPIHAFAWEPVGSKFAIIHGEPNNTCVSFYGVKSAQKITVIKKFEKRVCTHLFWSPMGQYIILAECREVGAMEFVDTSDFTIMANGEHYKATDVAWDPTGRYVTTSVSAWKHKMDTGYWFWSFQGKVLRRQNSSEFCQFAWRPRPPTLLSSKQLKDIKKNLKKYTAAFESKDRIRLTKASKDVIEKRQRLMKEFQQCRTRLLERWMEEKPSRLELRRNIDTDELDSDVKNVSEEVVEFLVKEEVTVVAN